MAACTYRPTASHPPRSNVRLAIHTHHHRFRSHTLYGPDDSDRYAAEPHPVHRQRHAHVPCTTRTRALYHTHICPVPHALYHMHTCPVPHAHVPCTTCTRALYHMHTCPVPHAHMPRATCTRALYHMHMHALTHSYPYAPVRCLSSLQVAAWDPRPPLAGPPPRRHAGPHTCIPYTGARPITRHGHQAVAAAVEPVTTFSWLATQVGVVDL